MEKIFDGFVLPENPIFKINVEGCRVLAVMISYLLSRKLLDRSLTVMGTLLIFTRNMFIE